MVYLRYLYHGVTDNGYAFSWNYEDDEVRFSHNGQWLLPYPSPEFAGSEIPDFYNISVLDMLMITQRCDHLSEEITSKLYDISSPYGRLMVSGFKDDSQGAGVKIKQALDDLKEKALAVDTVLGLSRQNNAMVLFMSSLDDVVHSLVSADDVEDMLSQAAKEFNIDISVLETEHKALYEKVKSIMVRYAYELARKQVLIMG